MLVHSYDPRNATSDQFRDLKVILFFYRFIKFAWFCSFGAFMCFKCVSLLFVVLLFFEMLLVVFRCLGFFKGLFGCFLLSCLVFLKFFLVFS